MAETAGPLLLPDSGRRMEETARASIGIWRKSIVTYRPVNVLFERRYFPRVKYGQIELRLGTWPGSNVGNCFVRHVH